MQAVFSIFLSKATAKLLATKLLSFELVSTDKI